MGRNDGASQNADDLMDYAADLGCFSSSDEGKSHGVTFNPGSDTGGTDNPLNKQSKTKSKPKGKTSSNGLTFSDHEVDVTSMAAGRMVINK